MKKKILLYMLLLLTFLSLLIMYKIKNVNAFALYAIPLPQEEKFDIKIIKIEKYKVWEMKNVYLYHGDYSFKNEIDGKKSIRRFYMVNKNVDDIDGFSHKFMAQIDSDFLEAKEEVVNYYFYRKSKRLPKYWTPVWDRHCIDELTDHEEDLLFIVTTDINKNILNIDIKKKE